MMCVLGVQGACHLPSMFVMRAADRRGVYTNNMLAYPKRVVQCGGTTMRLLVTQKTSSLKKVTRIAAAHKGRQTCRVFRLGFPTLKG